MNVRVRRLQLLRLVYDDAVCQFALRAALLLPRLLLVNMVLLGLHLSKCFFQFGLRWMFGHRQII
jgi:hypothetical protein